VILGTIGATWNGQALPEAGHATVRLWLTPEHLHIQLRAPFHGDPPPPGPPGPTAGLWSYEVVEVFLLGLDEGYTEVELSPHGHHLVLRLRGVRRAVASELPLASYEVQVGATHWTASAALDRSLLPSPIQRWNAYRIHGTGPERQYLAMAPVPGEAPDFHRLHCFAPWPG